MTESQWLKATDGDAMLAVVQDRLSYRKWTLLACGVVRRLWDILPDGPYRDAIHFRESHPDEGVRVAELDRRGERLADALPAAVDAAEARQREIVAACDPDADSGSFAETAGRRVNPAVPLYRAASGNAANAIEVAGQAVRWATGAVEPLFSVNAPLRLSQVRRHAIDAAVSHAAAGATAALALEFKAKGDEMADLGQVKNPRVKEAQAREIVDRLSETVGNRIGALADQKAKSDRKSLAKLLLEQLGNPFRAYRFDPRWRTEAVVGIARAIDEDRAVERYPILLDALLDANCDEEAILRHVRGTESHHPDPAHAVGCWVLDLILRKDEPLYALPALKGTKSATGPGMQLGLFDGPVV